jgi:hypothetical protein
MYQIAMGWQRDSEMGRKTNDERLRPKTKDQRLKTKD